MESAMKKVSTLCMKRVFIRGTTNTPVREKRLTSVTASIEKPHTDTHTEQKTSLLTDSSRKCLQIAAVCKHSFRSLQHLFLKLQYSRGNKKAKGKTNTQNKQRNKRQKLVATSLNFATPLWRERMLSKSV